jgi:glutamine amidotransferase
MLGVVNLGISNLSSVINALDYLKIENSIIENPDDVQKATHLLLPGVGTFEAGMMALTQKGLVKAIRNAVLETKKPILGICLGMQLLFDESDESPGIQGLKILEGKVVRLKKSTEYSLPRIGWCESAFTASFLSFSNSQKVDFYYIHSFHAVPENSSIITLISGEHDIVTSAVNEGNVYGVQFHPEKSHIAGLKILEDFARI